MSEVNSVQDITATLLRLPEEIRASDDLLAMWRNKLAEAKETLELAEANAAMRSDDPNDDKKSNAEVRKAQMRKSIATDPDAVTARKAIRDIEYQMSLEESKNKSLGRQFVAVCHVSERQSAELIFRAKGITK